MKRLCLASMRVRKGYKPKDIAKKLNISCNSYYKYENGLVDIPLSKAQQIAIILKCPLDDLFPVEQELMKEDN